MVDLCRPTRYAAITAVSGSASIYSIGCVFYVRYSPIAAAAATASMKRKASVVECRYQSAIAIVDLGTFWSQSSCVQQRIAGRGCKTRRLRRCCLIRRAITGLAQTPRSDCPVAEGLRDFQGRQGKQLCDTRCAKADRRRCTF